MKRSLAQTKDFIEDGTMEEEDNTKIDHWESFNIKVDQMSVRILNMTKMLHKGLWLHDVQKKEAASLLMIKKDNNYADHNMLWLKIESEKFLDDTFNTKSIDVTSNLSNKWSNMKSNSSQWLLQKDRTRQSESEKYLYETVDTYNMDKASNFSTVETKHNVHEKCIMITLSTKEKRFIKILRLVIRMNEKWMQRYGNCMTTILSLSL